MKIALGVCLTGFVLLDPMALIAANGPPGGAEFDHLVPHVRDACAVVRTTPEIFPYRSFPYGPLGLEIRKAGSPAEADRIRGFYLGVVIASCGLSPDQAMSHFFCGPQCPANRRDHLVGQLSAVRTLAATFEKVGAVHILAVWAPKGELRVNDLFLMGNEAREALPSPRMGFVPSGDWKSWPSLASYLKSIQVSETAVLDMSRQMLAIGLSALIRDPSGVRLVGVGIGDNESGLMMIRTGGTAPRVGAQWRDGRNVTIVELVAPDVYYYETS